MMFSKSTWAVVGLNSESLETFRAGLKVASVLFETSQLVASATAKFGTVETAGINPFGEPRKDEGREFGAPSPEDLKVLHDNVHDENAENILVALEAYQNYYGKDEAAFRIHDTLPWYGLWYVLNTRKDVSHIDSIKEHISNKNISRPYKLAGREDKKLIDVAAVGSAELIRKQFPVLLDFDSGRVYIESSSEDEISSVLYTLRNLGVETYPVKWAFGTADWITDFIKKSTEQGPVYQEDIRSRAEEVRTFTGGELRIIDDPLVAKIVEKYFSVNNSGTGLQVAFSPTVTMTLYPGGDPITVANPSDVINLWLGSAVINTAHITFQEVVTKSTKKGTRVFINDLFTFDLNPNCILWEAGAALLRGFDVPGLKKAILREMKRTKSEQPLSFYWAEYLRNLNEGVHVFSDNIGAVLDVRVPGEYGIVALSTSTIEENVSVNEA